MLKGSRKCQTIGTNVKKHQNNQKNIQKSLKMLKRYEVVIRKCQTFQNEFQNVEET